MLGPAAELLSDQRVDFKHVEARVAASAEAVVGVIQHSCHLLCQQESAETFEVASYPVGRRGRTVGECEGVLMICQLQFGFAAHCDQVLISVNKVADVVFAVERKLLLCNFRLEFPGWLEDRSILSG